MRYAYCSTAQETKYCKMNKDAKLPVGEKKHFFVFIN